MCQHLCTLYQSAGIDMMIMKGLSVVSLYPVPDTREFGDIDIYTSNHKIANDVISSLGVKIDL